MCGSNNCKKFGQYYHDKDDCCEKASTKNPKKKPILYSPMDTPIEPPQGENFHMTFYKIIICGGAKIVNGFLRIFHLKRFISGQRCAGRNYQGRRCCTPENPCDEGEGDCDGPGDGGGHDGHAGCK